jgi:hypothetical protein
VKSHLATDTPNIRNRAFLENPVALGLVAEIDDPATLRLPLFSGVIGEFAEAFSTGNAYSDRDAGASINLSTNPPAKRFEITGTPAKSVNASSM